MKVDFRNRNTVDSRDTSSLLILIGKLNENFAITPNLVLVEVRYKIGSLVDYEYD